MTSFKTFEEIDVWKEARQLVQAIRKICKRPACIKDFAFVDQITRSARSISANIAEGSDAHSHAQFITFLGYAKRSAAETRSHLYDALDENYVSKKEFEELTEQTKKIGRMIGGLIKYLQQQRKT